MDATASTDVSRVRMRRMVVEELVITEKAYVRDLQMVQNIIREPLSEQMSPDDIAKLFGNIDLVTKLHEQIVESLCEQEALSSSMQMFGATFMKYVDFMKIYSTYCSNMNVSRETLRLLNKVPPFAAALALAEKNPQLRTLTIGDYLIKPIQRITKYPLLLKELIENTDPSHSDRRALEQAQVKISAILDKINAEKREYDAISLNQLYLKDIQQSIDDLGIRLQDNPNRKLVQKSTITLLVKNNQIPMYYFLFNDILLVCKIRGNGKYQLKYAYPFHRSLVRLSQHCDFPECFELLQMENKDKVNAYGVTVEDKDFLFRFLKDSIYAQTLHIDHIIKSKYGWFIQKQPETISDLAYSYRLYCSPMEFLQLIKSEYPIIDSGKDVLWQFIDGLTVADFRETPQLDSILATLISAVKNSGVQSKMTAAVKKAQRSVFRSISESGNDAFGKGSNTPSPSNTPPPVTRRRATSTTALDQNITLPNGAFTAPRGRPRGISDAELSAPPVLRAGTIRRASVFTPPEGASIAEEPAPAQPEVMRPATIAQAITRRESKALRAIRSQEIVFGEGPNLELFFELSTWTSRWINTKILALDTREKRGEAITAFIATAEKLRELHNYNGVMEVLTSLHSPVIEKLKDSWQKVPANAMAQLKALDDFMSPTKNFIRYREELRNLQVNTPCIPYLYVFVAEADAIETPEFLDGKVNMEFVKEIAVLLRELRCQQKTHHKLSKKLPWIYADGVLLEEQQDKMATLYAETKNEPDGSRSATARKPRTKRRSIFLSAPESAIATNEDWEKIMAVSEVKWYNAGDVIMHDKDGPGFFLITQGNGTMSRKGKVLSELGVGDLFVSFALFDERGAAGITVMAIDYMEVKVARVPYVKQILDIDIELAGRFYRSVASVINSALRSDMTAFAQGNYYLDTTIKTVPLSANLESTATLGDLFEMQTGEVVIKSYECKYKKASGTLSITNNTLYFYGKIFGVSKQKQIDFWQIKSVDIKNSLQVKKSDSKYKFSFKNQADMEEACNLIRSVNEIQAKDSSGDTNIPRIRSKDVRDELDGIMSSGDWQRILKGSSNAFFPAGAKIITRGSPNTSLYQILSGTCNVQIQHEESGKDTMVGRRVVGDIFGEMSFFEPRSPACTTVIATSDVEVCVLDFHYVTVLLSVLRHLAGKFYKYLALLLCKRLLEFEKSVSISKHTVH